ncbi:hypothetical protein ACP70R_010718 [Stipagrostis hirtigluma subsp. patula]
MENTGDGDFPPLAPEAAPFVLFLSRKRGKRREKEAFYSVSQDKAFKERMVELNGGKTLHWITPDGWFLVCDRKSCATFLWTPMTKQRIELPPLDEQDRPAPRRSVCLLSHKPADPNCVVLLAHLEMPAFWFCRRGAAGSRWAKHDYAQEGMQITRIAAAGGEFRIDLHHSIATLRFTPSPTFTREAVEHVGWMDTYHAALCRLVESCGELFKVVVFTVSPTCSSINGVRVYRMDFSGRTWRRVTEFGDRAFFLDPIAWGASCSARQFGLDQGCVYFLSGKSGIVLVSRPKEGTTQLWRSRGGLKAERVMYSFLMPLAPCDS